MKDSFKYNSAVGTDELAAILEALAEGAREGRLPAGEGGRQFSLHPRGLVDINLKVRRKGGRSKVTLDLAWADDDDDDSARPERGGEGA